ncbi:MAG: septum formation protein Maf [Nitrospirales bacterium]|nr:septum formation protein Maf [Nitrospirales bacterium]
MHLILASTSPRRQELLALLDIPFDIMSPTCAEESTLGQQPSDNVQQFALEKAQSVANQFPNSLVLGGDTLIEIDQHTLGKPWDMAHATHMLRQLRGRCHQVHSGISLVWQGRERRTTTIETTQVWMKAFTEEDLQNYVKTGESLGKAGAYSIQGNGSVLIDRVEGDYLNIVGLPLWEVATILEPYYPHCAQKAKELYQTKLYANWREFAASSFELT